MKRALTLFLATAGGVGFFPVAPGTFGSMVGVAIFLVLPSRISPAIFLFALLIVFFLGLAVCGLAEEFLGEKDSPKIVIDEVAGQMIAMVALISGPMVSDADLPYLVGASFVLFRFFDILKPWPIRNFEDIEGGAGVMLDDAVAGTISLCILLIARMIF